MADAERPPESETTTKSVRRGNASKSMEPTTIRELPENRRGEEAGDATVKARMLRASGSSADSSPTTVPAAESSGTDRLND